MTRSEWNKKLKRLCRQAGTYEPYFDEIIDQLAQILDVRDKAVEQFHESHDKPVVVYTNKGGYKNLRKNPALQMMNECNQQALAYWRDLGLTPAGYKKLNKGDIGERKTSAFENMLSKLDL